MSTLVNNLTLSLPKWAVFGAGFIAIVSVILLWEFVRKLKNDLRNSQSTIARSAAEWSYAMDFLEDPMYLVDLNDNLVRANRAFYAQIGKAPHEALGHNVRTLIHLKPEKTPCPACAARLARRDAFFTKEADDPTNPTGRPIEVTIRVVRNDNGYPIGMLQGLRDLSHLRETEAALRQSQTRLANAQRIAHIGSWDWQVGKDEMQCSEQCLQIFGLPLGTNPINMETYMNVISPHDRQVFSEALQAAQHLQKGFSLDHTISTTDGSLRCIHQEAEVNCDDSGKVKIISGTAQDITARKLVEKALFDEKERAQVTLNSIGDAVFTTNVAGLIEYINPVAEKLVGISFKDITGKHYGDVLNIAASTSTESIQDTIEKCIKNSKAVLNTVRFTLIAKDNKEYTVTITVAPILGHKGERQGSVLVIHDVTDIHNMTRLLNHQATHDELTGLINRREFDVRLKLAVENAIIDNCQHALLYMDLDKFKIVNDSCGHLAGDELLKQIANLIGSSVRQGDTFARLGGDEFALLLLGCPLNQAQQIAENITALIKKFSYQWHGQNFDIGISIGLTLITHNDKNSTQVLGNADAACYIAKNNGSNLIKTYDEQNIDLVQHREEIKWVQKITKALSENQFQLYCQEILPINNQNSPKKYFEFLLRMMDEQGQMILPNSFIPAAERFQLMPSIDRWVIKHAFTAVAHHNSGSIDDQWLCSINLSAQSLGEQGFLNYIIEQRHKAQLNPQSICFEITETAAIDNLSTAQQFIQQLKNEGFLFALDDFGSGMSSFTYLRELNVDILKIDGSFVKEMAKNRIDYAMVSSINQIGQLIGIQTVAEFVEDEAILALLKTLNVDFGQGFGIDKPKPLASVVNNHNKKQAG